MQRRENKDTTKCTVVSETRSPRTDEDGDKRGTSGVGEKRLLYSLLLHSSFTDDLVYLRLFVSRGRVRLKVSLNCSSFFSLVPCSIVLLTYHKLQLGTSELQRNSHGRQFRRGRESICHFCVKVKLLFVPPCILDWSQGPGPTRECGGQGSYRVN